MRRSIDHAWRLAVAAACLLLAPASLYAQDSSQPSLRSSDLPQSETVVVTAPRVASEEYTLGPSDKLRVTVYGEDDLSGEFQIDTSGFVRLPLIGQMKAQGLTARELELEIEHALSDGYLNDPRVSVEVTVYRPIYVIGQVNKPGEYPYVSNMSGLNAIALAGGYTGKAVESTLYVRHEGDVEEVPVATEDLARVRPGDVLRVRETAFWNVADVLAPITGLAYVLAVVAP